MAGIKQVMVRFPYELWVLLDKVKDKTQVSVTKQIIDCVEAKRHVLEKKLEKVIDNKS